MKRKFAYVNKNIAVTEVACSVSCISTLTKSKSLCVYTCLAKRADSNLIQNRKHIFPLNAKQLHCMHSYQTLFLKTEVDQ